MKRYELSWTYYDTDGYEDGRNIIRAKSPSEAERRFYKHNRPVWLTCDGRGYSVNSIREV